MGIGLVIYGVYGYRHSRLRKGEVVAPDAELPGASSRLPAPRGGRARGMVLEEEEFMRSVVVAARSRRPPSSAADELSTSDRLDDRRFVTIGPRAYELGTEAGRYPAAGFHTRGEMGASGRRRSSSLDGIWFGVGSEWIGPRLALHQRLGPREWMRPSRAPAALRHRSAPTSCRASAAAVLVGLKAQVGHGQQTVKLRMQTPTPS